MDLKSKRILSFILTLLLILPSVFTSNVIATQMDSNEMEVNLNDSIITLTKEEKVEAARKAYEEYLSKHVLTSNENSENSDDLNYDPNEKVRVIVEINNKALKDYNVKKDLHSLAKNNSLKNEVLSTQNNIKSAVQKVDSDVEIRHSYYLLLNGFSAETTIKDIDKIANISGVKRVTIVNKYYPDMNYAKTLTRVNEVWNELGLKGEGQVVSIIDSGVDPYHKDMRLSNPELCKIKSKSPIGVGKYFNEKVPYGYNFADGNTDIVDRNSVVDGYMHGMHVAGIVAANGNEKDVKNNKAIQGIAPEAQILAMKVFSNEEGSRGAFSDDIVAAIEDSIAHDADVINMSLGSVAGFQDPNDPQEIAIREATERGIIVCTSAGNSRYSTAPDKLSQVKDHSVTGSPGLSKDTIAVASYENTNMTSFGMEYTADGITDSSPILYTLATTDPNEKLKDAEGYELVDCNIGKPEDFQGKNLAGKIALVKRGTIDFAKKQINAEVAGASGIIVYNQSLEERPEDGGDFLANMATDPSVTIPALFISHDNGMKLIDLISKNLRVYFKKSSITVENPETGDMSDFTSWGPAPNLEFKPEISAPGGNIWSTANNNSYMNMSGTSMASPHIAGIMALLNQRLTNLINDNELNITQLEKVDLAKSLLINTAIPKMDPLTDGKLPFSPRRQGAGLADAKAAIDNFVTITGDDGKAVIALKDILENKKTFKLTLTNYGKKDITYEVKDLCGIMTEQTNDLSNDVSFDIKLAGSSVTIDKNTVTVQAGQTSVVNITLNLPEKAIDGFVEGYIRFVPQNADVPEIGVPYMGYYGRWDLLPILDQCRWEEPIIPYQSLYFFRKNLLFDLGTYYNENGQMKIDPNKIAMTTVESPYDVIIPNSNVTPNMVLLRNVKEGYIEVVDENGEVIRKIATYNNLKKYITAYKELQPGITNKDWQWDGTVYNPASGKYEVVKDGQYYIQMRNKVDYEGAEFQTLKIPVKLDSVPPTLTDLKVLPGQDPEEFLVSFKAKDDFSGIQGFYYIVDGNEDSVRYIDSQAISEVDFMPVLSYDEKTETYTIRINGLYSANHDVDIIAQDYAGNLAIEQARLNNSKIKILAPEEGFVTSSSNVTFKYEIPQEELDAADTVAVMLDFANPKRMKKTDNSYEFIGLSGGKHTLVVATVDEKGYSRDLNFVTIYVVPDKLTVTLDKSTIVEGYTFKTRDITVKGKVSYLPKVLKIMGNDVEVDQDTLTFATDITLNEGLTNVTVYSEGENGDVVEYGCKVFCDVTPPQINLDSPILDKFGNYTTNEKFVTLKGSVIDNVMGYKFYINGEQIISAEYREPVRDPLETKRDFEVTLPLNSEISSIELKAIDMFGNETIETIKVLTTAEGEENPVDDESIENLPINAVIIGNEAFDIKYLNNNSEAQTKLIEWYNSGKAIFVKITHDTIVNIQGEIVEIEQLEEEITYYDANGNTRVYINKIQNNNFEAEYDVDSMLIY